MATEGRTWGRQSGHMGKCCVVIAHLTSLLTSQCLACALSMCVNAKQSNEHNMLLEKKKKYNTAEVVVTTMR